MTPADGSLAGTARSRPSPAFSTDTSLPLTHIRALDLCHGRLEQWLDLIGRQVLLRAGDGLFERLPPDLARFLGERAAQAACVARKVGIP